MSYASRFRDELNLLFERRTDWLQNALGSRPGAPPIFNRKHVDRAIINMQELASDALSRSMARHEFDRAVYFKKSWHVKRGKGRGYREKRDSFKDWYEYEIESPVCIYVFWRERDCMYVGKTANGAWRPSSHFDKVWFQSVTRVDIYSTRGRRPLSALECLAIHRFQPKINRFRPAKHKWTTKCQLCKLHREIEKELRSIFGRR